MQLWARAFRDNKFYAAVNTNNGIESLNKLLKYSFMPRKKAMTLSAVTTLIVETFLPDTYQKYLFMIYKQSPQYRSYKSFIPDFLQGRPRSVIIQFRKMIEVSQVHTRRCVHSWWGGCIHCQRITWQSSYSVIWLKIRWPNSILHLPWLGGMAHPL